MFVRKALLIIGIGATMLACASVAPTPVPGGANALVGLSAVAAR